MAQKTNLFNIFDHFVWQINDVETQSFHNIDDIRFKQESTPATWQQVNLIGKGLLSVFVSYLQSCG